ncbi:MAG: 3-dehydroquinate synthase family protein [Phycisphaerales bacterium]|nr:3-dehydroquinate synthase family protein [Phycisphaerales bacterium]
MGKKVARAAKLRTRTLKVKTAGMPRAGYSVLVGSGLIESSFEGLIGKGQKGGKGGGGRALVVVDAKIPRETIEPLIRNLDRAGVRWAAKVVTASEADKSLSTLEATLIEAARLRLERGDLIIAVGGGIVTDLAGFAAGIYRRGVRIVQCPTTLLAMVDAAVGGKTAANLSVPGEDGKAGLLKNAVGVFHQPARVVCDVASLRSLPLRELKSGLAECFKHGLLSGGLGDRALLAWTEKRCDDFLAQSGAALAELVARNVAVKARVVQADEREESTKPDGGRMMLNLGHTFAHAIETLPGLAWKDPAQGVQMVGPLKHGEAVGVGLVCAARVSAALKLCEKGLPARVEALLNRAGLPTRIEGLPASEQIIERMGHDKKVAAGKLRLVLPIKACRTRIRSDVPVKTIAAAIDAVRL